MANPVPNNSWWPSWCCCRLNCCSTTEQNAKVKNVANEKLKNTISSPTVTSPVKGSPVVVIVNPMPHHDYDAFIAMEAPIKPGLKQYGSLVMLLRQGPENESKNMGSKV